MAIVSPTTLVLRTWDAARAFFAVLFGTRTLRSIEPISQLKKNAEIANALLEVSNVLEKLNAWSARQNQREAREARKQLDQGVAETGPPPAPLSVKDRKALLRARRRAQRFGGQVELNLPPPLTAPILRTPEELPEDGDGNVSSDQGGQD